MCPLYANLEPKDIHHIFSCCSAATFGASHANVLAREIGLVTSRGIFGGSQNSYLIAELANCGDKKIPG